MGPRSQVLDIVYGSKNLDIIYGSWVPGPRYQVEDPVSQVPCMGLGSRVPGLSSHFSSVSFRPVKFISEV